MKRRYFFKGNLFLCFLLLLSVWRLFAYQVNFLNYDLPSKSKLRVWVCEEPKKYYHKQELVVCSKYPYKILIVLNTFPSYDLYENLEIKGNFKKPKNLGNFDYREYLYKQNIYFISYYPNIGRLDDEFRDDRFSLSNVKRFKYNLWSFKKYIASKIERKLPEPGAGLAKAMLLGLKTEMDPKLKTRLENLGLAHILAISGLHISILSALFYFFLNRLRVDKKYNKKILIIFLIFYLAILVFPVSATRAVIMIIIGLSTNSFKSAKKRLFIAGTLMIIISPQLFFEVSMQMSFLAVFSLIFIFPRLNYFFLKHYSKWILNFKKSLSLKKKKVVFKVLNSKILAYFYYLFLASVSVNIILWPIILYYFSNYNILSIFINLLILPILPLMLSLLIIAILMPIFSEIFFYPVYMILVYINNISYLKMESFFININISLTFIYIYYLIIIVFFITKNRSKKDLQFVKNI